MSVTHVQHVECRAAKRVDARLKIIAGRKGMGAVKPGE